MEYSNTRDEIAAIRQKLKPNENLKYSTIRDELGALRQVINSDPGVPADSSVHIDLTEFEQMTAQEKCDLFDRCIEMLKLNIPVSVTAYGATTFSNSFSYTETDGSIVNGVIGFLSTYSVPSFESAIVNAATVKKENGNVTFKVASIAIGS